MTTPASPTRAEESATTREEMDFDDSEQSPTQAQEAGKVSPLGSNDTPSKPGSKRVSFQDEEAPPSKPPRPMSPNAQAENTLIEAFPSIDGKVVKAVLAASGGKMEPAFNALLGMSDPNFKPEEAAPPQPPRPSAMRQPQNQMEADEMYARQLAEHFNSTSPPSRGQAHYNQRQPGQRRPNQQRPSYTEDDREHSFFDDDLPEIGRNIQQGFMQTQKTVTGWLDNLKKRIDGEEGEDDEDLYSGSRPAQRTGSGQYGQGRQNFGPSQSEQLYGIRRSAEASRRSVEASRNYDADPHELDDSTFQRLELRDDEARTGVLYDANWLQDADSETAPPQPPRRSGSRGAANPDLFKPQPKPPQSGPVDEVDAMDRKLAQGEANGGNKKWQSLTSVTPTPEEDNDPFSLGDDDDDNKNEDTRKQDSERLKEKARASVSAGAGGEESKGLQASERSGSVGTKNKEAEELLSGKKEEKE